MKTLYTTTLVALCAATLSYGDIIAVSNFAESENGGIGVNSTSLHATSFTTGDLAGGYELNTLGFQYGSSGGSSDNMTLFLYSSLAGEPGSSIADNFAPSGAPGDYKEVLIGGVGTIHLDASTEYFVIFESISTTSVEFTTSNNDTSGDVGIVGNGWAIGNNHWKNDGGAGWETNTTHPIRLSIGVIPEPSVHLLLLMGGGFVVVGHRWRTRSQAKDPS